MSIEQKKAAQNSTGVTEESKGDAERSNSEI